MVKPLALVMVESPSGSEHVCTALKSCGWTVVDWRTRQDLRGKTLPAILVYDLREDTQALDLGEVIRDQGWIVTIPRIGLGEASGSVDSFDEVIGSEDAEQLKISLGDWRPPESLEALDRIAVTLGPHAVAPIVTGLRNELGTAVAELDAGRYEAAHRIAGLAGTLGFPAVSKVWNALSHGDMSLVRTARREARIAMAAIDRWLIGIGAPSADHAT